MRRKPFRKPLWGILIIFAVLVWLSREGVQRGKAYYKTVEELVAMGDQALGTRLRVAGEVVKGSLAGRGQKGMQFKIAQAGRVLSVVYVSERAIPDTFADGSPVLVEGALSEEGVFQADQIQAKCASKYEARYQPASPGAGT